MTWRVPEAARKVALAVLDGGTREDAERHGAAYPQVKAARPLLRRDPEVFALMLHRAVGLSKARRLAGLDGRRKMDVEIFNLPALCDEAVRDLGEARDIASVLEIRNRAEAMRVYARKKDAALHAQNRCTQVVALCERRIGKELIEGKERGEIAGQKDAWRWRKDQIGDSNLVKPTLADLGLTANQSSDYQALARAPEKLIHETVVKANAENRPVSKTEMERAARAAAPKGNVRPDRRARGATSTTTRKPGRPALRAVPTVEDGRLARLSLWITTGSRLLSEFGAAQALEVDGTSARELRDCRDLLDRITAAGRADQAA